MKSEEISHDSVSKVRMANRRLAALRDGMWKRHSMNFLKFREATGADE
jgi:hypothetical protein